MKYERNMKGEMWGKWKLNWYEILFNKNVKCKMWNVIKLKMWNILEQMWLNVIKCEPKIENCLELLHVPTHAHFIK